jgi:Competence protein
MNKISKIQHLALDCNGKLLRIEETIERKDETFLCPHCKQEVIGKYGKERRWHFAHKKKECDYDKYLHSIAEIQIAEWFNKEKEIILDMIQYDTCIKNKECPLYNEYDCKKEKRTAINLKDYYSECLLERKYGNFIADLLCKRNHQKEDNPIFIEIYVSHKCTEEKIKSGIRIIEISIEKEEDITKIINNTKLKEGDGIKLYNFKRDSKYSSTFSVPVQKYILFKSRKSYVQKDNCNCQNYKDSRKGVYEITINYNDCVPYFINSGGFYNIGITKAYQAGLIKKDCHICKWQKEDTFGKALCVLYKKYNTPKYCEDNDAHKCINFKDNKEFIQFAAKDFEDYKQSNGYDIWVNKDLTERI